MVTIQFILKNYVTIPAVFACLLTLDFIGGECVSISSSTSGIGSASPFFSAFPCF